MTCKTSFGLLLPQTVHLHAGNEHCPASDWRVWHGIDPPQRGSKEQQGKQPSIYRCGTKHAESLCSRPADAIERANCLIACSPIWISGT